MPRLLALHADTPLARPAVAARRCPARDGTMLASALLLVAGVAVALYLVAPTELRDRILLAYLAFDEPSVMDAAHPPVSP